MQSHIATATSSKIVLPDVSLAAIVRDELINPAGGIVDFVDSTVPFVEEAVIVDTGSKDGTRQALEELQVKYPQLRVFDRKFDDYASCRNYSLGQVRTKSVLVLDADERIREQDFSTLAEMMKRSNSKDFGFKFMDRYSSMSEDECNAGQNPRLFLKDGKQYRIHSSLVEYLCNQRGRLSDLNQQFINTIIINHFVNTVSGRSRKSNEWYENVVEAGLAKDTSPSDLPGFQSWKAYNPRREEFR